MIGTRSSFINTGMPSLSAGPPETMPIPAPYESSCSELRSWCHNDQLIPEGQLCRDRRITAQGNMVMFCSDVFPKGIDTPQFCFPRHRNAKPCVFQIGIKIQQIRSLGKEQELMLWIFTDLYKYLVSPFRLPSERDRSCR